MSGRGAGEYWHLAARGRRFQQPAHGGANRNVKMHIGTARTALMMRHLLMGSFTTQAPLLILVNDYARTVALRVSQVNGKPGGHGEKIGPTVGVKVPNAVDTPSEPIIRS